MFLPSGHSPFDSKYMKDILFKAGQFSIYFKRLKVSGYPQVPYHVSTGNVPCKSCVQRHWVQSLDHYRPRIGHFVEFSGNQSGFFGPKDTDPVE